MKNNRNTPEYWASLVEQHFHLGNDFALIPAESFSEETAVELANRLNVRLGKWDDDYIFEQNKPGTSMPSANTNVVLH